MKKILIIPIFIPHLGCPHKCVFCNQRKITGRTTTVTVESIKNTIEFFLRYANKKERIEVAFFGGTFTGLPITLQRNFLDAVKPYIEKGYVNYIRLSTRPDYINEDILIFLRKHYVKIIELGVQSLIDEILIASIRGHTSEDVINASRLIKDFGFILGHQIMPGLPKDTEETILETVRKSIEISPDIVRIYPTLVLKDTLLYKMYSEGKYRPLSLEETVRLVAISYLYYMANNIKVIRIGLQTTDEINEKHIISGPYHPSIGELVKSKIYFWMIRYLLEKRNFKGFLNFYVNPKDITYFVGYKRINILKLKKLGYNFFKHIDNNIKEGEIVLEKDGENYKISLVEFSKKVYKNSINIDLLR